MWVTWSVLSVYEQMGEDEFILTTLEWNPQLSSENGFSRNSKNIILVDFLHGNRGYGMINLSKKLLRSTIV